MNILIVGNGFDIAHDLPTTYLDFIKFLNVVKVICEEDKSFDFDFFERRITIYKQNGIDARIAKYLDDLFSRALIESDDYSLEEFISSNPLSTLSKLVNFSKDNIWLDYFSCKIDKEKNYWAGFEEDISIIVQEIDKLKSKLNNYSLNMQSEFSENMSVFLKNITIKNDFFQALHIKILKSG